MFRIKCKSLSSRLQAAAQGEPAIQPPLERTLYLRFAIFRVDLSCWTEVALLSRPYKVFCNAHKNAVVPMVLSELRPVWTAVRDPRAHEK